MLHHAFNLAVNSPVPIPACLNVKVSSFFNSKLQALTYEYKIDDC